MSKYEAMFITKSNLGEPNKKNLFAQITSSITKNDGKVISSSVWADKKKLGFPINKHQEADYFLVNFQINPSQINPIKQAYRLNEDILRLLILKEEA